MTQNYSIMFWDAISLSGENGRQTNRGKRRLHLTTLNNLFSDAERYCKSVGKACFVSWKCISFCSYFNRDVFGQGAIQWLMLFLLLSSFHRDWPQPTNSSKPLCQMLTRSDRPSWESTMKSQRLSKHTTSTWQERILTLQSPHRRSMANGNMWVLYSVAVSVGKAAAQSIGCKQGNYFLCYFHTYCWAFARLPYVFGSNAMC